MKPLIPFNRRNDLTGFSGFEDFYNLLDDFFTPRSLERGTFKLDLQEGESDYIVEAELPGVKKEEVGLDFDEGRLTISVEHQESNEDSKKSYLHRERRYTSMSRSIYLADASPDDIKAKLDNGILNVVIQKKTKPDTTRKISIE
jgi:HSP20 family protein